MLIRSVEATPLSVPLRDPFVIANARIDATRAVLVRLVLEGGSGRTATGLGEAAALPPVTREDQPDLLATIAAAAESLSGLRLSRLSAIGQQLDAALGGRPVARAGVECALLDAWARLEGVPVCTLLRGRTPNPIVTDITLPIAAPARTAELAAEYRARGFRCFKVKVGQDLDADERALLGLRASVPDAVLRLDANEGFEARQALELLRRTRTRGLDIECFEQPCARDDLDGMAQVARDGGVTVVADESVQSEADLVRVIGAGAAHGINLKLSKAGGLLPALALGERARTSGMSIMCGGMVETRLGMTAMAHVACALGGADFADLDTAFLLASDPFEGGYVARGPELTLSDGPGLGVWVRA